MSKGLLIQNHKLADNFIERLFGLYDDEAISWDAARGVGSVVAPSDIFTKNNHSVIKVLSVMSKYLLIS